MDNYELGSVNSFFYLGSSGVRRGQNAGALWLHAETSNVTLYRPAGLELFAPASDVEPVTDTAGVLRQVRAPQCLADIVTNGAFSYTIYFYRPSDLLSGTDSNGCYRVQSNATPIVYYSIANPAASTNDTTTLLIAKNVGGAAITNRYSWTNDNGVVRWTLSRAGGLRKETLDVVTQAIGRIETRSVQSGTGGVAMKKRTTYQTFGMNDLPVEEVVDPDGLALTNTFSRTEDGLPLLETRADGSWVRHEYGSQRRKTVQVTPSWLDQDTNAAAAQAHALYYEYTEAYDYVPMDNWRPRVITEKIQGTVVGRTYYNYYHGNDGAQRVEVEERDASGSAAYGAAGNQRTVRVYAAGWEDAETTSRQLSSVTHPDGRTDTYSYEAGCYVTNADHSQCVFTVSATGEFARVTIVHATTNNPSGIVGKSTKDVSITDPAGRTVQQETWVFTGGSSYARIAWTVYKLDEQGRMLDSWRSDGSHESSSWSTCCGKEWETNAVGEIFNHMYDALGRRDFTRKEGIAAGTYPAQAPVDTTWEFDAEGRKLSQTVSGGSFSQTTSNSYDTAGRLTSSVDAAGLVTSYAYSSDGRTETVTLPGGATRITARHKSGQTLSVTGTAGPAQYYDYGVETNGCQWTRVLTGATNSPVWVKTTNDMLGRPVREERPGFGGTLLTKASFYDNAGHLVKTTSTGQPDTLFTYDELGNQIQAGLDVNGNGTLDIAGLDRIAESDTSYVSYSSAWWLQTVKKLYATDNSATATTNSITRQRLTGFTGNTVAETISINSLGNQTVSTTAIDPTAKKVTQTVVVPDSSSNAVSISVNGLVQSQTSKSGITTTFAYDALGRQTGVTDPRSGASAAHYDTHGWVDYFEDAAGHRTTYTYDSSTGQKLSQTDTLSNTTFFAYSTHGQIEKTWGSAAYPVLYEYDGYDRMIKLNTYRGGTGWSGSTWPASPGTADTTTWKYHETTGLLTNKLYADGKGTAYAYTPDGKLASRTWARVNGTNSLVTTYSYSTNSGDLAGIDYSDSTPDVAFTYDRLGRQKTAASSVSAHAFAYDQYLQLTNETIVAAAVTPWTNVLVRIYDQYGRPAGFNLNSDYQIAYSYDSVGRFGSASSSVQSASSVVNYSYLPNSDLISSLTADLGPLNSVSTRTYEDHRNLLTQVKNAVGATNISQYDYVNDDAGRRTSVKNSGEAFDPVGPAFNVYSNNSRGELISANRYFGTDLGQQTYDVPGQQYAYSYDSIGNRTTADEGAVPRTATYTANALNQYTQRTVPGVADVLGAASTNATVTVNNQATTRHGAYFHKALDVDNDDAAAYPTVTVVAVISPPSTNDPDIVSSQTGHVFLAQTPEAFTYDDDGNLLTDGRFNYSWDCENRLIGAETLTNLPASVPRVIVEFAYDYMSRRVSKTVSTNSSFIIQNSSFLYNGWDLLQEKVITAQQTTTNWYVHGLDLSGTLSGAGGIGGLLSARYGTNDVAFTYDGNGNVSELIDSAGGIAAHYEYSPFGATIVATGPLATQNKFRFSTKPSEDNTGLILYEHRPYSPLLGRWPARDPDESDVDQAKYAFVRNAPQLLVDPDGRKPRAPKPPTVGDIVKCAAGEALNAIKNAYGGVCDKTRSKNGVRAFCHTSCSDKTQLDNFMGSQLASQKALAEMALSMANCLGLTKANVDVDQQFAAGSKTVTVAENGCVTLAATVDLVWKITTPDIPIPGHKKKPRDGGDTGIPSVSLKVLQNLPFSVTWCPGTDWGNYVCEPCKDLCQPGKY